jgi:serine/threonine protein kinase
VTQVGSNSGAGVNEGDILAGKYRVERVLGVGGMGVVVAAHHMQLDQKVALKFLLPEALHSAESVGRFLREARAAVKITNEHVARVIDVGTLENGAPYMVMEYLEGADLGAWLRRNGALAVEQAVEFVLQACVAVADAHALGIVHRDLKPGNLFCVRRSDAQLSIKVLDFGISKVTGVAAGSGGAQSMTKTSALMGTPVYMAPEQMRSTKTVDARTDIWALGVVLFELLAGRTPFASDSLPDLVLQIAHEPPPSLRLLRADVPAGLEAVILKCIEKEPGQRYSNVSELAQALLPFAPKRARASVDRISGIIEAAGLSVRASVLPASPAGQSTLAPPGTTPPVTQTAYGVTGVSARKKAVAWALAVASVLGAAVGGAALLLRPSPNPPPRKEVDPSGASSSPPPAALDAETPRTEDAALAMCTPDATRCSGSAFETCNAGQWVDGAITAGQCGAVCTPGSSPPQCSSLGTPQTCAPTGQWQDGPACNKSSSCRDGVCVHSFLPPHDAGHVTARPSCDPPFTLDDQGAKHFKHECFPKN